MQKFFNSLPLLAIAALIWFHFQQPKSDRPKLAKPPSQTESRRCEVVETTIYDGDTFRVKCDGREQKIRLCGIDAPEAKQPLGIESRNYLRSLIAKAKGQVIVIEMDRDKYGRTVAEILFDTPEGEQSVQEEMLKAGFAYHYKQYSSNCHNREYLMLQRRSANRNNGECGGFPMVVKDLGIIENRIRLDTDQCWVYTKVVGSERNSRKCGNFLRVMKNCENIFSQSVN